MQVSILRSAAVVTSAVLAGSVITGISPAAAESTACVATELKLPAGTPTEVNATSSRRPDRPVLASIFHGVRVCH